MFGKSTQAMKAHWKVPDNRPLSNFAPTIILKAKDFAAEITIFYARQHQMGSEGTISREHITRVAGMAQNRKTFCPDAHL